MKRKKLPNACGIYTETKHGQVGYRARIGAKITGGTELKKFFPTYMEAEEWILAQSGNIKRQGQDIALLSAAQATDAKEALELVRASTLEVSLVTIAKDYVRRHAPNHQISIKASLTEFLADRSSVSASQADNLSDRGHRFLRWCSARKITLMSELEYSVMREYLKVVSVKVKGPDAGKPTSSKTIHHNIKDLSNWFNWCLHRGRRHLIENPASDLELPALKPSSHVTFITAETARQLFAYLEDHYPKFCAYFALALFSGIRVHIKDSELVSVVAAVKEAGWRSLLDRTGKIKVPKQKVQKNAVHRYAWLPPVAKAWIEAYPEIDTPKEDVYRNIRKKFSMQKNCLRHTAISAYLANGGSISTAAIVMGNTEEKIRSNYYVDIDQEEAKLYYLIMPKKKDTTLTHIKGAAGRPTRRSDESNPAALCNGADV